MTERRILRPEQLDDLGRALLKLAQDVWVIRDRQRVLEQVLAEKGIDVAKLVEDYQPQGEFAAQLEKERRTFIRSFLDELMPGVYRS